MAKKRRLNLEMSPNHSDDTPVVLTDDAKAAATTSLKKAADALYFVMEFIKNGSLTVSARYNGLAVAISDINHARKLLGGESDLQQDMEGFQKRLREANEEIRRLEKEMTKGITAEAVGNKLGVLMKTVSKWWESIGFNYCTGKFNEYGGLTAVLHTSIDDHISCMEEDTPVTAKQKKQEKVMETAQTLDLIPEGHGRFHVVDSPKNRAWVINKIKTRFPSVRICKVELQEIGKADLFEIDRIEVYIPVDEIEEQDA
jgi:hypothetical protein